MFERLTDRSRKVFEFADAEAARLNHPGVHTGHVLHGLIREGAGVAGCILQHREVNNAELSQQIAQRLLSTDAAGQEMASLESAAAHAARRLDHRYFGTEHLLLGVTLLPSSAGSRSLVATGASPSHIGQEVLDLLGHFDTKWQSMMDEFVIA